MMSTLERRCRRLLLAYSSDYRRQRGTEVLSTLLDMTPAGRSWPTWRDCADVVIHGLRQRVNSVLVTGLRAGLSVAGPVALASCAGLAVYLLVTDSAAADALVNYPQFGPFATIGPVMYTAIVLTCLAHAALPRADYRPVALAGLTVSAAVVPVAALTGHARPSLHLMLPMVILLVIGVAGTWQPPKRGHRGATIATVASTAGIAAVAGAPALTSPTWWILAGPPERAYAAVVSVAFLGTLLVGTVRALTQGDNRALWAALILLVPTSGPVLLVAGAGGHHGPPDLGLAWLPLQLAVAGAVVTAIVRRARLDPVPGSRPEMLRPAGTVSIGFAAGLALFVWIVGETPLSVDPTTGWRRGEQFGPFVTLGPLAYPIWISAAISWAVLPARWVRLVIGMAIVTTVALPILDGYTGYTMPTDILLGTLTALGIVAFAATSRPARRKQAVVDILTLLGGTLAALTASMFALGVRTPFPEILLVGVFAAMAPLGVAAVTAWPALRSASGTALVAPATVLLTATGWMAMMLIPYPASWPVPVMFVVLIALVGGAVAAPSRPVSSH